MKKFILIDHEPWTLRRKELYYDLFADAGVSLTVWDLSKWLHPGLNNPNMIVNEDYLIRVSNEREFKELLDKENPDSTIIVEEVFRNWNNRRVYRDLSERGYNTIKLELYGHATLIQKPAKFLKDLKLSRIPGIIRRRIESIAFKWYISVHKIRKPLRLLSSNSFLWRTDAINHPDYEKFRFGAHRDIIGENYIVFCDIYFPLHPDLFHFCKIKSKVDVEKYRSEMRKYFDYIEKRYDMPVIIAAHPKSDYKGAEFGNRKIIKYETDNLVNHASMMVLHVSGALSYGILNDLPLAFVETEDYLRIGTNERYLKNLANRILGMPFYNLDKDNLDKIEFRKVDPNLRKEYIYTYLTSEDTENIRNQDLLRKILQSL